MYLVGFILRIYHDARSPESQILFLKFSVVNILSITIIFKFCGEIGTCFAPVLTAPNVTDTASKLAKFSCCSL